LKVIADTSFLFALTSAKDRSHEDCVTIAGQIDGQILVPDTILPETAYLLMTRRSHRVMRSFIRELQLPLWNIISLEQGDLGRVYQILEQYEDAKLDFPDATIVAMAERLNIQTVLTLDRRDFRVIRPKHVDYFSILP
jgi:predicted nucleic acid-binding protein